MTSGGTGSAKTEQLLRVSSLSVDYLDAQGSLVHALQNVDLEMLSGQCVGVLGESGSGKSSLALALMRLLPRNARVISGRIELLGRDLDQLSSQQLQSMRGGQVALISQEPALALNPVLPLGSQIMDVLRAHSDVNREQAAVRCEEMLRQVGFPSPERIMRAYPHQLSGGQRQRVAIAQALICRPQLLIADEPLSSLDAATQAEILDLLQTLRRELGLAMLFITHNAGVLASLADRIVVMRSGEVVAQGSMAELQRNSDSYLQSIVFPGRMGATQLKASGVNAPSPLLQVRNLSKKFVQQKIFSRHRFVLQALEDVDLELNEGETMAVLGRSGSGKSTLARCIAGFETPDSGRIEVAGDTAGKQRPVQMIFQDAATSLNPRFTACQIVAEPMEIAHWGSAPERSARSLTLMEEVGLDPGSALRPAGQFSGGQRQRLALARALAANPRLLILDEAFSGLDLPLQAQMVRLLQELQQRHGLAFLYIAHDMGFVATFAHKIVVMDAGRIVERLAPSQITHGSHPATHALIEAGEKLHAPGLEAVL